MKESVAVTKFIAWRGMPSTPTFLRFFTTNAGTELVAIPGIYRLWTAMRLTWLCTMNSGEDKSV